MNKDTPGFSVLMRNLSDAETPASIRRWLHETALARGDKLENEAVLDIYRPRDRATNRVRNFVFIKVANEELANHIVATRHKTMLGPS